MSRRPPASGRVYIPRSSAFERAARFLARHAYALACALIAGACILAFASGVGFLTLFR